MALNEKSQPEWVDFTPVMDQSTNKEIVQSSSALVLGVASEDKE